jgi:hypothetical protein
LVYSEEAPLSATPLLVICCICCPSRPMAAVVVRGTAAVKRVRCRGLLDTCIQNKFSVCENQTRQYTETARMRPCCSEVCPHVSCFPHGLELIVITRMCVASARTYLCGINLTARVFVDKIMS